INANSLADHGTDPPNFPGCLRRCRAAVRQSSCLPENPRPAWRNPLPIPEEWKAWSQNLGHESEMTTFVGYGQVPGHRQAEIMQKWRGPQPQQLADGRLLDALETLIHNAKRGAS